MSRRSQGVAVQGEYVDLDALLAQTHANGRHGCPACAERFDSVGDKKRHMRTQHDVELNSKKES